MRQHERWQVSGKAAKVYEHYLVPTLFMSWAHDLIARATLQPGERVLDAVTYFARAVGAASLGQTVRARQDLEELRLLRAGLTATRQGAWAAHVEILSRVAAAWVAQREGQYVEAVQHIHAAADLEDRRAPHLVMLELIASAHELLGEMLLERGEFARAVRVFEAAIESAPQRGNALYRAARAAELADDLAKAQGFYAQLLGSTASTTGDRIKLAQGRAFLANLTVILPWKSGVRPISVPMRCTA